MCDAIGNYFYLVDDYQTKVSSFKSIFCKVLISHSNNVSNHIFDIVLIVMISTALRSQTNARVITGELD